MTRPLLLLPLLAGCALPPPSYDIALGRDVARSVEEEVGLYPSAELTRYVDSVARRVEAHLGETPFEYRYAILDQLEPNAFAAPGGHIYVSRGLLAVALSEDELAGVIGHELIHVDRRHTAQQLARPSITGVLGLPGRVVGGVVSSSLGNIINAPIDGIGALSQASYGRSQETEADILGEGLMSRAGYRPDALADILARMEAFIETATGESRRPTFFDSHPPTPDRVKNIRARAARATPAPRARTALTNDAFLQRLDGLVFGENPAQGVFTDARFLHADLDIAIEFPDGWATLNTPKMAGAISPQKDALVFYGIAGAGDDAGAAKIAAATREKLRRDAGLTPTQDETRDLNGDPARLLVYTDRSGGDEIHVFFLWVARNGLVHQFVGLGPESDRAAVRQTVRSLRALTHEERSSIMVNRIRIVKSRAGETLETLGERTGNVLRTHPTAILNGLRPAETLRAGQSIKIIERGPYLRAR